MRFTFASWNVNNRRFKADHADLISRVECDVLALQEANVAFHLQLASLPLFQWSVSSLMLRPPGLSEGRARRLGCSLFGRSPFRLVAADLLAHLAFPERALVAVAGTDAGAVTLGSFHTPPGANWGKIKPDTLASIAKWLTEQNGRVVFGIDANAPKTDHPNPLDNEWWWDEEPVLLGPLPSHHLRDAFRVFLDDRPEVMSAICAERPRGPLATSHFRGRGRKRTACRYDFIYTTHDFDVEDVAYLMEEGVKAGSDHALVAARLRAR
jgi:endonuclease/exonuclease/phosphatase family metal-dependent hydrolase